MTELKAAWDRDTLPVCCIRFFPFFCFSSSFILRVWSPPPTVLPDFVRTSFRKALIRSLAIILPSALA